MPTSTPTRSSPSSSSSGSSGPASASSSSTTGSATARSSWSRTRSSSPGRNFGCGSSREHAPWALEDFGFEAIVAPSFADIFYSNCTKVGLLPAILYEEHCRAVAEAGEARIDVDDETVTCAAGVFEFEVEPDVKHRLLNGLDDIGITLENAGRDRLLRGSGAAERRPGDDGALRRERPMKPARASGTRRPTTRVSDPQFSWGRRCSSGSS